jgi:hypothetical protein
LDLEREFILDPRLAVGFHGRCGFFAGREMNILTISEKYRLCGNDFNTCMLATFFIFPSTSLETTFDE